MSNSTSCQINSNLFLIEQKVSQVSLAKPVELPVNHIVVIDCSGSMSYDLPKIREQLKRKIPKLLNEKDTLSIIWFSGRGQFGVLLEAEPVATLTDLQQVNQAIDRWLRPVGLTGFKEPLEEVSNLIERLAKKSPGRAFSLFFMSDGCDNVWSRNEILKAAEKTAASLSSATFVEFGFYADRPLLTMLAEKTGGCLIFSEDFDRYAPQFESVIQKKLVGSKRVEMRLDGEPIGGFVYALNDNEILTNK
jgi:Mg-chelatase subunit ChlD